MLVLIDWWSDIIEDTSVRLDVIVYVISSFLFVCSYICIYFLFLFWCRCVCGLCFVVRVFRAGWKIAGVWVS